MSEDKEERQFANGGEKIYEGGPEAYIAEGLDANGNVRAKQLYFDRKGAREFCAALLDHGYSTVRVRHLVDPARTNNTVSKVGASYD
jgi:arabinogalactan endo-1,4-beta-galactosidase